jgi:hypothetical protein
MEVLFCIRKLGNAAVVLLALCCISVYHMCDLIWVLSCPVHHCFCKWHPSSLDHAFRHSLSLKWEPCCPLTSHFKYQQSSCLENKSGKIWEMTKTLTSICFCCYTVAWGCLSLRMWWACLAHDVEGPVLPTYLPSKVERGGEPKITTLRGNICLWLECLTVSTKEPWFVFCFLYCLLTLLYRDQVCVGVMWN